VYRIKEVGKEDINKTDKLDKTIREKPCITIEKIYLYSK
jgi:hypothetical protein